MQDCLSLSDSLGSAEYVGVRNRNDVDTIVEVSRKDRLAGTSNRKLERLLEVLCIQFGQQLELLALGIMQTFVDCAECFGALLNQSDS